MVLEEPLGDSQEGVDSTTDRAEEYIYIIQIFRLSVTHTHTKNYSLSSFRI